MSKPAPRTAPGSPAPAGLSILRTAAVALMVVVGVAWMVVYLVAAQDGDGLAWMAELRRWNFLVGWGLVFLGLALAAHPRTPLGRGRGIVVGMLGCFLFGLVWIVTYYVTGADFSIPLMRDLGQYNLVVGVAAMAVGFVYATRWE